MCIRDSNYYLDQGCDAETARREAAKWVAAPGTSEHNLGLAADLVSAKWYSSHDDLTEEFEQTPEFEWLAAHCAEYGFILRYPKGKTCLLNTSQFFGSPVLLVFCRFFHAGRQLGAQRG